MQAGLGHLWFPEDFPLAFYAAGGLTYVPARFELTDKSREPRIDPLFPDQPIYPDMAQSGHFIRGYVRTGGSFHIGKEFYAGIGLMGKLTTNRNLPERNLNINSTTIGSFFGGRN